MPGIQVIAGACGKGAGAYEAGLFTLPDGSCRPVEAVAAIESQGGVSERAGWGESVLGNLKGGLGLASNLDISGGLALAASVIGAGLPEGAGGPRERTILEVAFADGTSFIAVADVGLSVLIANDREVVGRAFARFAAGSLPAPAEPAAIGPQLVETAGSVLSAGAGAALTAASSATAVASATFGSALSLVRRRREAAEK